MVAGKMMGRKKVDDLATQMDLQKVGGSAFLRELQKVESSVPMKDGPMELLMVAQMDLVFPMELQKVEGLAFLMVIRKVECLALWKAIV